MKTALRTTLATIVLAALAMGAHAQAPKDAPKSPGAEAAKIGPKTPALYLQCPEVMQGAVQEHVQAKVAPPWKLVRSGTPKGAFAFQEAILKFPQSETIPGTITCRYQDLETTLVAQLPRGCEPRFVGPWTGGSGVGTTRLPTKNVEAACKPAPVPAMGTQRIPTQHAPTPCAIECPPPTKRP